MAGNLFVILRNHERERNLGEVYIAHYWLVDPEVRTVDALELTEGSYRLAAAVGGDDAFRAALFPDLVVSLRELWR